MPTLPVSVLPELEAPLLWLLLLVSVVARPLSNHSLVLSCVDQSELSITCPCW